MPLHSLLGASAAATLNNLLAQLPLQLIVASIQEDWEEKIDEDTNRPYYVHTKTGESSWEDADERCANAMCVCACLCAFASASVGAYMNMCITAL